MSRLINVDMFVEDRAHEEFLKPLLSRIAGEEDIEVQVRVRSSRGGHGRAVEEFKLYQTLVERGAASATHPDLLIVGIDGNCTTFARKRAEIQSAARATFSDRLVVACPLLSESDVLPKEDCADLLREADEIARIIGSIIVKTKRNHDA